MSQISRRRLLTSGAAAGVLAASGLPVAARHSQGGLLRVGLPGARASDGWDGRRHSGLFMVAAGQGAVFDCLTEVGADGVLRGELATGWQATHGARVWDFDLQPRALFHDGSRFTAEDVLASLALHRNGVSPAGPLLADVEDMRALSDMRVRFTLARPNPDFPYLLSDYHLLMYPAARLREALENGIGTGLYRVEEFAPGSRLHAVRVREHYKGDRAGFFDAVAFEAQNTARDRFDALASGSVDAAARVGAEAYGALGHVPSIQRRAVVGNFHIALSMRVDKTPYSDPRVRRALKLAVDRRAILDEALGGHGRLGSDTPVGPLNPYLSFDLPVPEYNPAAAHALLADAGLSGLSVTLHADTDSEEALAAAHVFARSAAPAGISVTVSLTQEAAPFVAEAWAGRATEDWMFATGYAQGALWNRSRWKDVGFQARLPHARAELDPTRRRALYAEMQSGLQADGGVIVPVFANDLFAVTDRIGLPDRLGSLWEMDNARMAERWWRA